MRRDAAHADLTAMLLDGAIDLAIVDPVPHDPRLANAVGDADKPWRAWRGKTGAQTLNHVVVVRESLSHDAVRMTELIRMFADSSRMAETDDAPNSSFIGLDAIRRSLEVAISEAWRQGFEVVGGTRVRVLRGGGELASYDGKSYDKLEAAIRRGR